MKTDLVEIFQTVRASLQPYASLGFEAKINTETQYALFTGQKVDQHAPSLQFVNLRIMEEGVELCVLDSSQLADINIIFAKIAGINEKGCKVIHSIDEKGIDEIETALSESFKIYKQKGWV